MAAKKSVKKTAKKSPAKKAAKKSAAKPKKARSAAPKAPKTPKAPKAPKTHKGPKKARNAVPTSGQSGPPLELAKAKLNDKEEKVVTVLLADVNPVPINALATNCFSDQTSSTANSWVRNSLRRLVRAKWVEKVGKGTYRLTDKGRERAEGGDSEPKQKAAPAPVPAPAPAHEQQAEAPQPSA
jgi:hypothetical protein